MTDLSPKSVALLETARDGFAPSQSARKRMRAAFLARVDGASGAPDAAARIATPPGDDRAPESAGRLALRANAGSLLAGLLVLLAGSTFAVMQSRAPAYGPAPTAVDTAGASAPAADTDTVEPASLVSPQALPEAPPEAPPVAPPSTPAPRAKTAESQRPQVVPERTARPSPPAVGGGTDNAGGVDSLSAEMQLVREAQAVLGTGDLERARRVVDAHASAYPTGVLREERLILGVLLHCAEGRTDRARQTAEELLLVNPRSSHLEPLRASCAGSVVR